MRIALICTSNMLVMPYVYNYIKIFEENDIEYEIINWDRLWMEEPINTVKYRDAKKGQRRNYLDYLKYRHFVIEHIKSTPYDKIIVFGIQLTYFLKDKLCKGYKGSFIVDIRDYNKIIGLFRLNKVIEKSAYTVLSSPGFMKWLSLSDKYLINHNTGIENISDLREPAIIGNPDKIVISYIGAIRDYEMNILLIESLKNSKAYELYYHGEGFFSNSLQNYVKANNVTNVFFTGIYEKGAEEELYLKSDLISVILPADKINSKTLLPNRLYHSVIFGKPVLAMKGSFLAETIQNFNLGLVIDSFKDIENLISDYIQSFDVEIYNKGRSSFIEKVIMDNSIFKACILDFIN